MGDGIAAGGTAGGGGVVQATMATTVADTSKLRRLTDIEDTGMWLLMLEAGVALFLLVFIVWWTASGRKPNRPPKRDVASQKDEPKP